MQSTDAAGNVMLHFTFSNLPPYAARRITVEATVDVRATPLAEPLNNPEAFLATDSYTDFRLPVFAAVPAFEGSTRSQCVAQITAWVRTALQHGPYRSAPRGAAAALAGGESDCTEYMHTVMALCRRAGVPARAARGFVCPRNMTLRPAMLHDWAQWHDGATWHMADAYTPAPAVSPRAYVMVRQELSAGNGGVPLFACRGAGVHLYMNSTE